MPTSPPTLAQVRASVTPLLPRLSAQFGLQRCAVFGSVARGTAKRTSDVDLLVDVDTPELSLFDLVRLETLLSDAVGHAVHLTERATLPEAVRTRLEREAVRLDAAPG